MLSPKVLVVDDEPGIRNLICEILSGEGMTCMQASSGDEALGLFYANSFDAIFTDIGMPRMNGTEFIKVVRSHNKDILIVVMSGWNEDTASQILEGLQIDQFIKKPFALLRIIDAAKFSRPSSIAHEAFLST